MPGPNRARDPRTSPIHLVARPSSKTPHRTVTVSTHGENTHRTAKNGRNFSRIGGRIFRSCSPLPTAVPRRPLNPLKSPRNTSVTRAAPQQKTGGVQGDDHHPLVLAFLDIRHPSPGRPSTDDCSVTAHVACADKTPPAPYPRPASAHPTREMHRQMRKPLLVFREKASELSKLTFSLSRPGAECHKQC
jgi:hypothetical protein